MNTLVSDTSIRGLNVDYVSDVTPNSAALMTLTALRYKGESKGNYAIIANTVILYHYKYFFLPMV